eukprot:887211-Amphidinium_carterae.2
MCPRHALSLLCLSLSTTKTSSTKFGHGERTLDRVRTEWQTTIDYSANLLVYSFFEITTKDEMDSHMLSRMSFRRVWTGADDGSGQLMETQVRKIRHFRTQDMFHPMNMIGKGE